LNVNRFCTLEENLRDQSGVECCKERVNHNPGYLLKKKKKKKKKKKMMMMMMMMMTM
jgi:hypothetical protein